jgi:hypothetical protein
MYVLCGHLVVWSTNVTNLAEFSRRCRRRYACRIRCSDSDCSTFRDSFRRPIHARDRFRPAKHSPNHCNGYTWRGSERTCACFQPCPAYLQASCRNSVSGSNHRTPCIVGTPWCSRMRVPCVPNPRTHRDACGPCRSVVCMPCQQCSKDGGSCQPLFSLLRRPRPSAVERHRHT